MMSDHKLGSALKTVSTLRAAEQAIAIAVAEAASLARQIPEAATRMGLSPVVARTAVEAAGQLVSTTCSAFRQVADVHRHLELIRNGLDLPELAMGDKLGINDASDVDQKVTVLA